jgi:hypothetical protein
MSTPDGYAIYHDMLHTTQPALWQRLEEQHRLAQTMQNPVPVQRSRESSLKSARRVGGKIARFILAVTSDPDLKTYSTKRDSMGLDGFWSNQAMAMPWMDPMTAAAYTIPMTEPQAIKRTDKGKGKAMAKPESDHERIARQDFAPVGATAVNSNSRFTGTTAVNSNARFTGSTLTRRLPSFNPAFNAFHRYPIEPAATEITDQSSWPEGDSQGNWRDARHPRPKPRPNIRGGASSSDSFILKLGEDKPTLCGGAASKYEKQRRKDESVDLPLGWEKPGGAWGHRKSKRQMWLEGLVLGKEGVGWDVRL